MKRFFAIVLALFMLTGLVACTKNENNSIPTTPELIKAVYKKYPIGISVSTEKIDTTKSADTIAYVASVTSVDKVSEIYVSAPTMTPPAYEMVVVRVKDAADAEAMAKEILKNADPCKWICVCADKVRVVACGDTIMMVMSSDADTKGLTEAFIELCGGKADVSLEK